MGRIKPVLKHSKLPKYYDQRCRLKSTTVFDMLPQLLIFYLEIQSNYLTKLFIKIILSLKSHLAGISVLKVRKWTIISIEQGQR